jgi:hypothetical protein
MPSPEAITKLFHQNAPLGPIEALRASADRDLQRFIFDHDNALYKELDRDKTLIIGRKGSGKTSLLNTSLFDQDKNSLVIALDSDDSANTFMRIVQEVETLSEDITLVEQVSKLWEVLFWGVALRVLYDNCHDEMIGQYLDGLHIRDLPGVPYQWIDRQLEIMKTFPPEARGLSR